MTDVRTEIENAILEYAKAADDGGDARFADDLEVYGGVIAHAIFTTLAEKGYVIEQGWQPIETAPRDGTWVLLIQAGKHPNTGEPFIPEVCHFSQRYSNWFNTEDLFLEDDEEPFDLATHWRPLPEPPLAARGE